MDNTTQMDIIYQERDELVSFLTRLYRSYLALDLTADEGWQYVVFVETPAGQMSWHVPDREALTMFAHLPIEQSSYDGHSTIEKYNRLRVLGKSTIF